MDIRTPADLGVALRNARAARSRTQAAVATDAGISRDSYLRIEHGHPRVELANVLSAIEALGLRVALVDDDALADGETTPSDSSDLLDSVLDSLRRGE